MARPRRLPADETRAAIVTAARELLCQSDAETLTARRLAGHLAMPASAIYRHFPTMADVIWGVNKQTFENLTLMFDSLPKDVTPLERLRETGRRYAAFMENNPILWRSLFEGRRDPASFPQWYGAAIHQLMLRIASLIRDACPQLTEAQSLDHAGRIYVLAHGALALHLDGRLGLVSANSAHDIIDGAVLALVAQFNPNLPTALSVTSDQDAKTPVPT